MPSLIRIFTTLVLLFAALPSVAAVLTGTVSDKNGKPLPFANIFVSGSGSGTTTNEKGLYRLNLKPGAYEVVYDYIGYKQTIKQVNISSTDVVLDIQLVADEIKLREVVVTGDEDPAYPIMRKAIAKRQFHYKQIDNLQVRAYVKGMQQIISAPDKILGQDINVIGTLDSNNAGIIYLSESISDLYFEKPDKVKEIMLSSKVSGETQTFSWNRSGDMLQFDPYKSTLPIEGLTDRVVISPLADNAMLFYRYRLEGYFQENGNLVNKIKVIPRRANDPVFSGYIYIVEDLWNIHSMELFITKQNQINFIDTLNLSYTYRPLFDSLWVPASQRYDFNFAIFGIKAAGYFVGVFQDHKVNVELPKRFFTNEIMKIEDGANARDSTYWDSIRPIPLTTPEVQDYARKDSLEELRESKAYLDSTDKIKNKFSPLDIFLGYSFGSTYRKYSVDFIPLYQIAHFNTVEGWSLRLKARLWKEFKNEQRIRVTPVVRYGIANKRWQAMADIRYYYNQKKFGYVEAGGGQYMFQFNRVDPVPEFMGTFYALMGERNFIKLYQDQFVYLKHRIEITNGLFLFAQADYRIREAQRNHTNAKLFNRKGREYSSNIPENAATENTDFKEYPVDDHTAFILKGTIVWQPGQKYMTRPDMKVVLDSKWPQLRLQYSKAIAGVLGSSANFDKISFSVFGDVPLKLFGSTHFYAEVGTFLNTREVHFMDFHHFNANQMALIRDYKDGFLLMDYYQASTINNYVEAHVSHHFNGFLFNKIPGVRKLKLQAVLGVNFLYTEPYKDHTELVVSIENILRVMRIDFVTAFRSTQRTEFGFALGFNIGGL